MKTLSTKEISEMKRWSFLSALFSPFKPFKVRMYIGTIRIGVPYYLPRKKIGVDFCSLGWKTKWGDYRFEYAPVISFVFFKWQLAFIVEAPEEMHYWECWLYYQDTDKHLSRKERIAQCRQRYECIWSHYEDGKKVYTDYYNYILKKKYL